MDAISKFADHVIGIDYDNLPQNAVASAKTFILDSLGVGLIGSDGPWVEELIACQQQWGGGDDGRVWSRGTRLPAPAVAMCNAYQIHNCEFDCVHEGAVVHPVTVVLPSVLAVAERMGGITGQQLITAVALGVDVACHLGVAATSGLRFFRPGTAGVFAGVTGIAKLLGFDQPTLVNAYSIAYAQLCGTMQSHTEGSMLLGMQIAFNARNAVVACDMAQAGLQGPKNVLEGEFGYFRLIETENQLDKVLEVLGKTWRITEVAHKPFPSGRATHGVIDALSQLMQSEEIPASNIAGIDVDLPPLTHQLVGRPPLQKMDVNYARLCIPYVAARLLQNGFLSVRDFSAEALGSADSLALAQRVNCHKVDNPDPNALVPINVRVTLKDGKVLLQDVDIVYGNPAKPMSYDDQLEKFRRNTSSAALPLSDAKTNMLIEQVENLEGLSDLEILVDNLVA
jgi:2-methylcitrate dehydratase PrpD